MDFEPRYTQEQEEFRQEVRDWLKDNVPDGIFHPPDSADLTNDQYQLRRDLGRRLGAKGWLWPTAPKEYGGAGLSLDHAVVIEEEVDAVGLTLPPYYDTGADWAEPPFWCGAAASRKSGSCRPSFGAKSALGC